MILSFMVAVCAFLGCVMSSLVTPSSLSTGQHSKFAEPTRAQVTDIWKFPPGTWVENLAIRRNGQILATVLTDPQIYQIDPHRETPAALVHNFDGFRAVVGVVEHQPDIFYVVVGNGTFQVFPDTAGSFTVFKLDVSHFLPGRSAAIVTEVAKFPTSSYFNGIEAIDSSSSILLVADSGAGAVYSLDITTGSTAKVSADRLFAPTGMPPTGINGIKVRRNTLYFTNTQQQIFGSAPITPNGTFISPATVVTRGLAGLDDFAFDPSGNSYFAGDDQLRFQLTLNSTNGSSGQVIVASNDTLLQGSTAVAFGRGSASEERSLYVSSRGPIAQYQSGNFTSPGRILRVSLVA